jgi:Protein of unknown function (DUF1553)/Protein of unknown function (DUF1549)/Planctomycete cytochrome C
VRCFPVRVEPLRIPSVWLIVSMLASPAAGDQLDFERHVAPLLIRHCVGCHNTSEPSGGLDLTRQAAAAKGGESGSPAISPGQPEKSYLVERVRAAEMPPEGKGHPLSTAELRSIESWIAAGAAWPDDRVLSPFELTTDARAGLDWWSLKRPEPPPIPAVTPADRVANPIDAFVLSKLEAEGLEPAEEADRTTLIRRASLDLIGLPPTPEEIQAFVADPSTDAYAKLIDRLLASPRYGERWARHWLDVVRFGESHGYEKNTPRDNAWPYRDWVIAAFNDDLPYPDFILRQLAGDQFGVDAATGFLVGGAHDEVGSPDIELTLAQRMNDLDDMISTTTTAFLGLTAGCAKCHDHKFDPISQRDYYSLQAVFAGVEHGERDLRGHDYHERRKRRDILRDKLARLERQAEALAARFQPVARLDNASSDKPRAAVHPRSNVDRFAPSTVRFVRFTVLATNSAEPCIDELEIVTAGDEPRNVALVSAGAKATASGVFANGATKIHQLEHIHDGRYGNSHSWISDDSGAGWVQIELPQPATIDRVVWARDRDGKFVDRLPTRYRIEVGNSPEEMQLVATSDDRRDRDPTADLSDPPRAAGIPPVVEGQLEQMQLAIRELRDQIAGLAPTKAYLGTFKQAEATHILYRGDPMQQREATTPAGIQAVGPLVLPSDAPEAQRRVALGRWIGSDANPLTARVMVNRIWHYHFGRGLVATPSDFGFGGGRPSHPELLDYLATQFMSAGWRPKAIHRLILLSNTYRQSSRYSAEAAAKDANCRLLWRFPPRRLEAEAIRDSVLRVSGVLDLRMGGPGYDVFEPNTNYVRVYKPKTNFGPSEWRRMVYQQKPRSRQDATFGEFDCPDASQSTARRNVSTTALQALNLLNGPFMIQQAELLAARLDREESAVENQVRRAFWLALSREPDADERAAGCDFVRQQGLAIFCRALYNTNEFLYLD